MTNKPPVSMRVLLAGHIPPPIGGVGTYYQSLLSSSLPEKVNLIFVQTSTHNRELSQSGRATFSNIVAAVKDLGRFFQAVISNRPQICHIGTAFGLSFLKHSICVVIARAFGCRVLLHPHCGLPALYSERPRLWRWYFRQIIRLTDGLIALSSEWQQFSLIIPDRKVYLLTNAINLAPYQSVAQERLVYPHSNGKVHILYLGYIGQAKGSFDLVNAAQLITSKGISASFDLVGGELRPGELDLLHSKINTKALSKVVKLHQPVTGADKLKLFRDADIFVYPSFSEGMPIAVIEAMACGLPVVASNVGGLPDLIQEGVNGILIQPGCIEELTEALIKLANDFKLLKSMQEKSSLIASEQYDIEQHVKKLVEIYSEVIRIKMERPNEPQ